MTIPSNKDIYRSAKVLIDQMGDDALMHAITMRTRYAQAGNASGTLIWQDIERAILWMTMPEDLIDRTALNRKAN